jgi:hypothetical protein
MPDVADRGHTAAVVEIDVAHDRIRARDRQQMQTVAIQHAPYQRVGRCPLAHGGVARIAGIGLPSMPDGVLEYDELQLRIAPSDKERYHVVALGPDRSSADHRFAKPLESVELENFILRIGFPRKKKRGYRSKGMEYAREFGAKLFDALVAEGIREVYVGACKLAAEHDRGLRVTLYLTDVPELMVIPWEFLYDSSQRAFLSQSIYSPVVALSGSAQRPQAASCHAPAPRAGAGVEPGGVRAARHPQGAREAPQGAGSAPAQGHG